MRAWTTVVVSMTAILTLFPARSARAQVGNAPIENFQNASRWAIGYTANAPKQMVGFSTILFGPRFRSWGLYVDYKLTMDSPADSEEYLPSTTPEEALEVFNDEYINEKVDWTTVNVALVRVVTGDLAVYAGAGYSREDAYQQFYDDEMDRGVYGYYWARDAERSGTRVNLLGGLVFRATRYVMFQFGGETAPGGFTVGASLTLPVFR